MAPVIELRNVTYTYPLADSSAIRDMSFAMEAGGFYGIIGENGGGKTSLCALISGFIPAYYQGELKGDVLINDRPTVEYGPGELSLRIGCVFQNPFNQISGVKETVFEEVAFGLENFGVAPDEIESRVTSVMEMTNITDMAAKNPFDLSGGQQQRMALASIIVLNPDILVIDEPTSQLDPEGAESVFKIISMMKEEKNHRSRGTQGRPARRICRYNTGVTKRSLGTHGACRRGIGRYRTCGTRGAASPCRPTG
jgi:energy-coupling factor transport system ATP-binding protein